MPTKTQDPVAQAQAAADKANTSAQAARSRAQDAARALEAAQGERERIIKLVGSGGADADALAEATHRLAHAQELAQATAEYADAEEAAARLARLAVVQERINHFADGRAQAVKHMRAITEHVRALIDLGGERNKAAMELLRTLRAEGVASGGSRQVPREEDAGFMLHDLSSIVGTVWVQHREGRFDVNQEVAGGIVASAISRATEGNPYKLSGRVNLIGRFDHELSDDQVVRDLYGC